MTRFLPGNLRRSDGSMWSPVRCDWRVRFVLCYMNVMPASHSPVQTSHRYWMVLSIIIALLVCCLVIEIASSWYVWKYINMINGESNKMLLRQEEKLKFMNTGVSTFFNRNQRKPIMQCSIECNFKIRITSIKITQDILNAMMKYVKLSFYINFVEWWHFSRIHWQFSLYLSDATKSNGRMCKVSSACRNVSIDYIIWFSS